ncbi:autophagy-related protein 2 [Macadamia integrifolia]|uniref:autophagy-related protein 2 n=1 Tax=Macadamia integrifolia TaxID=60698 RepID=UPI001C4F75EB|nr:autophagy-related protein 2 [Macadamia integrifolia]XP_042482536.1 autophagy-related protein 2 [Macadamia integrifolia]
MFPWNFAKSADDMFSRWAIKRVCKFLLKKKLGQFILGDIDLENLEVQLRAGTIQLKDLALNVDFINQKLGASTIIVKEGSIGSLLVKVPWKGQRCEIEVDELEVVLGPFVGDVILAGAETNLSSQDCKQSGNHGLESLEHETVNNASTSNSLDVHEGVKTIAKMVKWLLTSFNIKIKKLIIAFDPCSMGEMNARSHTTLVLRVIETECGTCFDKDGALNSEIEAESFLGMHRLTNFIEFKGAVVELLQIDNVDNQSQLPCAPGSCPANVTTPILTGESGGFSGTLKLSIPWKNGSLDMRKVDADAFIKPLELRFQPSTIKWIICLWESLKNLGTDGRSHMNYKAKDLTFLPPFQSHSSTSLVSAAVATDKMMPNSENFPVDFGYVTSQETAAEALLPGSKVIPDWVPLSTNEDQGERSGGEIDYGASIDQFFECFDGMRSSQLALGNSGIWNLTCSVFSAITAASSLASGSLQIPTDQKHVETNLKATVSGISIILSFHDEEQKCGCDRKSLHYLGGKCGDVILVLQNSPQEMKFEATVKHIELDDYFNQGDEAVDSGSTENSNQKQILFIQHLQDEVHGALPSFRLAADDPVTQRVDSSLSGINSGTILKDDLVRVKLLKTSSVNHFHFTLNSTYSNDSLKGSLHFSVELPPFIFWLNFNLLNMIFDLLDQVGSSSETNNADKCFGTKDFSLQHDSSCHGGMKEGTIQYVTTLPQKGNLRGTILIPNARIFLCFPFKCNGDFGCYTSWDQFIAIDFCPLESKEKIQNRGQKGYSSGASSSIHLNFGNVFLYLINSRKDATGSSSFIQKHAFSAQKVFSVTSRRGRYPGVILFWQEGPVTGPWIAKKAQFLATAQCSMSRNKVMDSGSEFASVTTLKDLENTLSHARQEMILSSMLFLHVHLTSVSIHLNSSQYKDFHCLLNQVLDGLSSVASDKDAVPCDNPRRETSASQVSILAECDSVKILIDVDREEDIKSSLQTELPGSWYRLKLEVQRFHLLTVSNIGGISGAKFVWMGHGEGELWGSITGSPSQELLLISCSNSTIGRGDGEGANVLSSGSAGTTIVHLWDPQSSQCITSITIRSSTIVAPGGRLDWFNSISSFFSLPSDGTEKKLEESFEDHSPYQATFAFNLVDVALSYEPHIKKLVNSEEFGELCVACLLAAASLNISNQTVSNSIDNDYKIRVQDLGLLLYALSGSENAKSTYSVEHLRKMGYVKVAGEALVEATLRTNCKNGLLWEVECSESHIILETCHDTTSGILRLVAQLQQLFAPDVEESIVHLQTRWNNVQQTHDEDDINSETVISNDGSASSPPQNYASSLDSNHGFSVVGLMDEICEDAFNLNKIRTSTCDTCGSQFCISLNGGLLGDDCNLDTRHAQSISHNLSFKESMSGLGVESTHVSSLQGECSPEFIEGYYLSELCPLSELSTNNQSLPQNLKCKSSNATRDSGSGNSGWYQDTSLTILENHISDASDHPEEYKFLGGELLSTSSDGLCKARGRVLLKKIDVRWRMYAGTDWHDSGRSVQLTTNTSGRDATVCLELVLSKMDLWYDMFPDGEICMSKLSLSVQDFHLFDGSKHAPWKLVLGYYHSKDHPRESSAKAFRLDLEAVRPDPLTPLEEYRLSIAFLPMLVHLHQDQLDFLISFFGGKGSSVDQSPNMTQDFDGSRMSPEKSSHFGGRAIAEEALLPYFQKFDIWPVLVRVDYSPCRVDVAALRSGRYVELVNLVPWKGIELHLKHVHAVGVYGWNRVSETILGEWLEDISQNQIHKFLKGLPTVRSLLAVGSGATKLVSLPVKNYKKDHRLLKGIQRGAIAFLRSISLEAVGLGVHLAAGAHDILLQTEYILTNIPSSAPLSMRSRLESNIRSNQPKDAQQGIQQAYESLSDGLEKTASALVGTPLKTYQRGAGAGSALASAVRAAPVAAIAPASAVAGAVHITLLGVRNSLDPEHKKESMEKYLGPTQPREHS